MRKPEGPPGKPHPGIKMTLTPAVLPGLRTSPKRTCQLEAEEKTKTVPPHAPQAGVGPPRNKPPIIILPCAVDDYSDST